VRPYGKGEEVCAGFRFVALGCFRRKCRSAFPRLALRKRLSSPKNELADELFPDNVACFGAGSSRQYPHTVACFGADSSRQYPHTVACFGAGSSRQYPNTFACFGICPSSSRLQTLGLLKEFFGVYNSCIARKGSSRLHQHKVAYFGYYPSRSSVQNPRAVAFALPGAAFKTVELLHLLFQERHLKP
jgi:hypothetical protein